MVGRIGTQGGSVIEAFETVLEAERRAARRVPTKLRRVMYRWDDRVLMIPARWWCLAGR